MYDTPNEQLIDYLTDVYFAERPSGQGHRQDMAHVVRTFSAWARSPITVAGLNPDQLNRFLAANEEKRSPKTLRNWRNEIVAIWRLAWERGDTATPPQHVRRIIVPETIPDAWTLDQLARMLNAADAAVGTYPTDIGIAAFWGEFIRLAYDTALRLADLLALRFDAIMPDGSVVTRQHKTGTSVHCRVSARTVQAIGRTLPPRRAILLPWPWRREALWRHWRKYVLEPAGLPTGPREGPQKLRRTSASHLETIAPGAAMRHLGHRTRGLAERHYIDPRIAASRPPLPPELPR